jgi:hypothetical protein
MMRALLLCSCLMLAVNATAQLPSSEAPSPAAPEESAPLVEEVLVTGEQPGPGLWAVKKGDHTLWILGVQRPVPKKLVWRSKEIEALIARSKQVLLVGSVDFDPNIGFFKGLTLLPSLLAVRKNPDGRTLAEHVPPDVYARWLVLKDKYVGRDRGIEKFRPTFAAQELTSEALKRSGLTYDSVVAPLVEKAAKRNKVPIVDPTVPLEMHFDQPRAVLKKVAKIPFPDAECFATMIDGLERDLESMRERANAWAIGDVAELERLYQTKLTESCGEMLATALIAGGDTASELGIDELVNRVKNEATQADSELRRQWQAAAEAALASYETTFAVLPMSEIVRPEGRLPQLAAKGYDLIAPDVREPTPQGAQQ